MRKPPFNRPVFSRAFNGVFGRVFGAEDAFTPFDIPNLLAWYDATDPSTITDAGGGAVSAWADKSGNGNTVIQAVNPDRPLTGTQTINGLNTIAFDGILGNLRSASIVPTPNLTMAFVFNVVTVNANSESIISFDDNLAGNDDFQIDSNNNTQFFGDFNSSGLGSIPVVQNPTDLVGFDTALMYRLSTSDSSVRLFNANVEVDSDVGNYNGLLSADQQFIIAGNRTLAQFIEINIGEIVIVNRDITASERTNLFNYFSKWGV